LSNYSAIRPEGWALKTVALSSLYDDPNTVYWGSMRDCRLFPANPQAIREVSARSSLLQHEPSFVSRFADLGEDIIGEVAILGGTMNSPITSGGPDFGNEFSTQ
jgi:hypothetical protein